jgi:hypothetical protein
MESVERLYRFETEIKRGEHRVIAKEKRKLIFLYSKRRSCKATGRVDTRQHNFSLHGYESQIKLKELIGH